MKILCVAAEYPPHAGGGMSRYYATLLPELARLGHDVRVLVAAPFSPAFAAYDDGGVAVECVPAEHIAEQARRFRHLGPAPHLRRYLGAAWAAWEHAKARCRFDVVEVGDWGLLFAPWITEETETAVSVTLHGSVGQIDLYDAAPGTELEGILVRLLEATLLARADELVAYGTRNAEAWARITGRSARVVFPPFRTPPAPPEEVAGDGRGLVVARVQSWKGPQVLCEALRHVGAAVPPIRWVGRDMPCRTHASMSGMLAGRYPDIWGTRIEPVGPRPPGETAALQSRAAFVVIPSLWDVFNLAAVEALGLERVVIVSSGAGVSELIVDGVNGFVSPAGDPTALASVLERVVALDGEERRAIGQRGRELVQRELEPERIARTRAEAYARAVEQRRGSKRASVNEWVRDAVRPGQGGDAGLRFLDHVAVRHLVAHAGTRVLRRVHRSLASLVAALRGGR